MVSNIMTPSRHSPPSAGPVQTGWRTREDTNPEAFANPAVNTLLVRTYSRDTADTILELSDELSPAGKNAVRWAEKFGTSIDTWRAKSVSVGEEEKEMKQAGHVGSSSAHTVRQAMPSGGTKDSDSSMRSLKGRNGPRRLTRQMTLARCLSTDADDVKTIEEEKERGVTVWVGGIPSRLASDEKALHDLLAHHGGGGDSTQLLSLTLRLKKSDDVDARSWCLASFLNADAVDNLTQAVAAVSSDCKAPSTDEAGSSTGSGISQPPSTLIIKLADVPRQLFVRKLESIHAGKLAGMRTLQGEQGQLSRLSTTHKEKLQLITNPEKLERVEGDETVAGSLMTLQLSPRPLSIRG